MKEPALFHPSNPIPSLLPLNVLLSYEIIKQVLTNYNLDQDTQTDHETINGLPLLLVDTVLIIIIIIIIIIIYELIVRRLT